MVRWKGRRWPAPLTAVPAYESSGEGNWTCLECSKPIEGLDQAVEVAQWVSHPSRVPDGGFFIASWEHLRCHIMRLGGKIVEERVGQKQGVTLVFELDGTWPFEAEQRRLREVRERLFLPPVAETPPDSEPGWPGRCEKCKQPNSYDTGLDGASIWCSNPNCPEAPPEGWEPS